jgi:hypothetical protein
MTSIGPITRDIILACANELKKEDVKENIMINIVDPIFFEIKKRYMSFFFVYFLTNILIIILLIYVICKINKNYNN